MATGKTAPPPRRSLALLFLIMAGIIVCPPVVLVSIYLDRQTNVAGPAPPVTVEEARATVERLQRELVVARQYGLVWPEAEALAESYEYITEKDGGSRADFNRAATRIISEVVRRRDQPETWRPIPPRSLADVFAEDGRMMRRFWTPDGTRVEPVWLATIPGEQFLPGAEALLTDHADRFHTEAQRLNRVALQLGAETKVAEGIWFPGSWKGSAFESDYAGSLLMIGFSRYAPMLSQHTRGSGPKGVPLVVEADVELEVSHMSYFDPPTANGQRFIAVEVRPVDADWIVVRPVEGLTARLGNRELVIRDPVSPKKRLEGPCDLPGLVLLEYPPEM